MRTLKSLLRSNKARPKQAMLVETAFALFRKHGFQRVTIEEICAVAKVSKVTFYRYYSGKEELILYILRLFVDDFSAKIEGILKSDTGIKGKFDRMSLLKQKFVTDMGIEITDGLMHIPAARQYAEELNLRIWQDFQNLLQAEQAKGKINPHLDIHKSIQFIQTLGNVLSNDSFKGIYASTEEMISQVNEMLVMGLLSRDIP